MVSLWVVVEAPVMVLPVAVSSLWPLAVVVICTVRVRLMSVSVVVLVVSVWVVFV